MKTVTIKNLSIQLDIYGGSGDDKKETMEALEGVNLILQREPSDISAQVMGTWDIKDSDLVVEPWPEEEEE